MIDFFFNLTECEKRIEYHFLSPQLLVTALTHSSCASSHLDSNERLEFLGDATLGLIISNLLYRRYPQKTEGELSCFKSAIVSRRSCKQVAEEIGLEKFLKTGKGLKVIPYSLISNVVEAIIGAIFIDGGLEKATIFVEKRFSSIIETIVSGADNEAMIQSLFSDKNYKTLLQIQTQRNHQHQKPVYQLIEEKGPPHKRIFKVAVTVDNTSFSPASASTKKEAERRAAGNALYQMKGLEAPYLE